MSKRRVFISVILGSLFLGNIGPPVFAEDLQGPAAASEEITSEEDTILLITGNKSDKNPQNETGSLSSSAESTESDGTDTENADLNDQAGLSTIQKNSESQTADTEDTLAVDDTETAEAARSEKNVTEDQSDMMEEKETGKSEHSTETTSAEDSNDHTSSEPDPSNQTDIISLPVIQSDKNELFYGEAADLVITDYSEESRTDILQMLLEMELENLNASAFTVPAFQDSEVILLTDGTETDAAPGSKLTFEQPFSKLDLMILPLNGILKQTGEFRLVLSNAVEEEGTGSIRSFVQFTFSDKSEEKQALEEKSIVLKGIYTDPEPVSKPDTDKESSEEFRDAVDSDPSQKSSSSAEAKDTVTVKIKEEEKKPETVVAIIDHIGLDFDNLNGSPLTSGLSVADVTGSMNNSMTDPASDETANADRDNDTFGRNRKIETVSVNDVSEEYGTSSMEAEDGEINEESASDSSSGSDDPVITKEQIRENTSEKQESRMLIPAFVVFISVMVLTAALLFFRTRRKDNDT